MRKTLLIALLALSSLSLAGCLVEDRGFGRCDRGFERHDEGERHERFRGYGHDRD